MTSTIKVNNIQNQCGANIINESGNTITIGASGDTIALASGASQSGFGREGSVNWQTGSIKTAASFTAVSGEGYFVDTSSNVVTANLPAGSAGAIVAFSDYARNFQNNKLTISPNGSEKIGGVNADLNLQVEGQALTLVYVDGTKGWINVQNAEDTEAATAFISASGGTETNSPCGNYKIHTFTGPGTFTVSQTASAPVAPENVVSYLVIGGGGGGGSNHSGGGGAGGFREFKNSCDPYTASPLNGNPGGTAITVTAQAYPITVGGGGPGSTACTPQAATNGVTSIFSTIQGAGGGGGAKEGCGPGKSGGSGGGGTYNPARNAGGAGNSPPVAPPQGQPGGVGAPQAPPYHGGGGGGAKDTGSAYNSSNGKGGDGHPTSITGSAVTYSGGGGAGGTSYGQSGGGAGGAGGGGAGTSSPGCAGTAGTCNTGGGGGGGYAVPGSDGGNGGSGIVVIRYKFQ